MASYPGFIGSQNPSASYMGDDELLLNMYAQPTESQSAPAPWVLLPTPGYSELSASAQQAPGRANFSENGRNFFIAGFAFYEYTDAGALTLRGTVAVDANPAQIVSNGAGGGQLGIVSGDHYYSYDLGTNTLTTVLASGATQIGYLDGYFLVFDAATSTVQVSNLLDGTVMNPVNVFQRTAGSDNWEAMFVVNRLIYLLGSKTSEVWWNANVAAGQPFAPIQEAFSEFGIAAPFSGAVDTSLTFLGQNANGRGIVYRMQGYAPQRVSTHAVEVAIQGYSTISDAVAGITQQEGRPVYVLTFPTADKTHAFDEGTQLWHQREFWDADAAESHASRSMFFASLPTKSVSCDLRSGALFVIDPAVFTEADGSAIRRIRQAPRLSADQKRFTVNSFQLVMDVGVGLPGVMQGPGVLGGGPEWDPQVALQVSRDGGKTFGSERWASAGKLGTFGTRVRWVMLGQSRNFVPKILFSAPVPFRICDALVDVSVGAS